MFLKMAIIFYIFLFAIVRCSFSLLVHTGTTPALDDTQSQEVCKKMVDDITSATNAADGSPPKGESKWLLTPSAETKEQLLRGMADFKNVFFFPLCTGIMTGVGFTVGKKLAESYFYSNKK